MDGPTLQSSNQETGSLTQTSPHESRFIGSSSGIHFIKTVKRAFEAAGYDHHAEHLPPVESTVGGEDDFDPLTGHRPAFEVNIDQGAIAVHTAAQLGVLPPYEAAQQYVIEYFRTWHPMVPFLHGPEFLQEVEALYQDTGIANGLEHVSLDRRRLCYLVICQCVMSIGAAAVPAMSHANKMFSATNLLSLSAALASRHDILAVQVLLAAQTYCVSLMALRNASSLGGLLSKLIYHTGLHRCPYRYAAISGDDRELRKRILWSAYALDRYICQALGIPVSLTNSEIDVCVPGRMEIHDKDSQIAHPSMKIESSNGQSRPSVISREIILSSFVDHANLVGRALETFHVSIHSRNHDTQQILFLHSDVERWFNSLPEQPLIDSESSAAEHQVARFLPFFNVLYEQLVISLHRPSLSLPRAAPEFHHGLQVTIRAAKRTIVALEEQSNLFWPGYLAAVWMSGLIISFACQIGLYSIEQGKQEIYRCLDLLVKMARRWRSAQKCKDVLSTLLADLQRPQRIHRRTATEAFGENNNDQPAKQRVLDPALSGFTSTPSQGDASQISPGMTTSADDGLSTIPMSFDGDSQWDVNDFFQDLSWNNFFETNSIGAEPDLQFYTG